MSFEAMTAALNHSKASGSQLLVLLNIANHQGEQGAWPSVATLATLSRVSERRVQQCIRDLTALGELIVEECGGFGSQQYKTNRYWVNVSCPPECDGTISHKSGVKSSARGEIQRTSGVKSSAVRGEKTSTSGVKPIAPEPQYKPQENQKEESQVKPIVQDKLEPSDNEALFEEFWKVYPRRDGKLQARRKFDKALKVAKFEVILEGARRYRDDPNRTREFTKMPQTWLYHGCWDNEPLPERSLTAIDLKLWRDKKQDRQTEASRESARQALAESAAAEAYAKANPAPRCVHDRIAVMCDICNKKTAKLKTQQLEG